MHQCHGHGHLRVYCRLHFKTLLCLVMAEAENDRPVEEIPVLKHGEDPKA